MESPIEQEAATMDEVFTGVRLFLNIPAEVAHDPRFKSDKSILLFGEIYSMLNVTGKFYMSNKELAKRLRCSKRTVISCVNELIELGYITTKEIKDDETGATKCREIKLSPNWHNTANRADEEEQSALATTNNESGNGGTTNCDQKEQYNKTSKKNKSSNFKYSEFIKWFNEQTNKAFKNTETNRKFVKARLNEGFTKQELALVVRYKTKEWRGTKWEKYLRPSTLFSNKFGDYLEAAKLEMATTANQKQSTAYAATDERKDRAEGFMRNLRDHPDWFTQDDIKAFLKDFPEMKEEVLEIERTRRKSDSDTAQ